MRDDELRQQLCGEVVACRGEVLVHREVQGVAERALPDAGDTQLPDDVTTAQPEAEGTKPIAQVSVAAEPADSGPTVTAGSVRERWPQILGKISRRSVVR